MVDGKVWKASEWVKPQLGALSRRKITVADKEQCYFTKSIVSRASGHTVQIFMPWKQHRDVELREMLIANRAYWEVHRNLKTYRIDRELPSGRQAAFGHERLSA